MYRESAQNLFGKYSGGIMRIVGDIPDVKVCFDTNHYTKGTTEHFVAIVGSRIGTIHASDFDLVNECHWLPTREI